MHTNFSYYAKWRVLLSGIFGSTTCGMLLYSFSVLINPLQNQFGWSYTEVTLAFSICYFVGSFFCFPAGLFISKYGVKFISIIGAITTGGGFLLCAYMENKYEFYILYGIVSGMGCSLLYMPPLISIPGWWPDRYIFITGFAVVGLGIGSIFMGPLSTWIINNKDWKQVFIISGLIMLILGALSSFFILDEPNRHSSKAKLNLSKYKNSSVKSLKYWLLYLSKFCAVLPSLMIISQLVPYSIEIGYSAYTGSLFVSIFSIANTASRLVSGLIAEKIGIYRCLTFIFALQSIILVSIYSISSTFFIFSIWLFVIGWTLGTIAVLFPSVVRETFGLPFYPLNYGLILTASSLAGMFGSTFASFIKDFFGTYSPAFFLCSIFSLFSSFVIGSLFKKYC